MYIFFPGGRSGHWAAWIRSELPPSRPSQLCGFSQWNCLVNGTKKGRQKSARSILQLFVFRELFAQGTLIELDLIKTTVAVSSNHWSANWHQSDGSMAKDSIACIFSAAPSVIAALRAQLTRGVVCKSVGTGSASFCCWVAIEWPASVARVLKKRAVHGLKTTMRVTAQQHTMQPPTRWETSSKVSANFFFSFKKRFCSGSEKQEYHEIGYTCTEGCAKRTRFVVLHRVTCVACWPPGDIGTSCYSACVRSERDAPRCSVWSSEITAQALCNVWSNSGGTKFNLEDFSLAFRLLTHTSEIQDFLCGYLRFRWVCCIRAKAWVRQLLCWNMVNSSEIFKHNKSKCEGGNLFWRNDEPCGGQIHHTNWWARFTTPTGGPDSPHQLVGLDSPHQLVGPIHHTN